MPATITLYLVGVWFCFFVIAGLGWNIGRWIVNRTLDRVPIPPPPPR